MANRLYIEVGNLWTKVMVAGGKKQNPKVHQAFYFKTPEHSVEDGFIRDKETFANTLKKELSAHNVTEKEVVFSLTSSKMVTREMFIPVVKPNKIWDVIDQQITDYLPVDVANYTLAYVSMGTVEEGGNKKQQIQIVAIPNNIMPNYTATAKLANLVVGDFDVGGHGTYRLLRNKVQDQAVIVQVEEGTTIISVLDKHEMKMQRLTPYGFINTLNEVVAEPELGCNDVYEAFDLITSKDMVNTDEEDSLVRDSLQYHVRMVKSALEYYNTKTAGEFNGTIYLQGDGARIIGLASLFEKLGYPVQHSGTGSGVAVKSFGNRGKSAEGAEEKGLSSAEMSGFTNLMGSAIETINMKAGAGNEGSVSADALEQAKKIFLVCVALSVIICAVGGVRLFIANQNNSSLQSKIDALSYLEAIYAENESAASALSVVEAIEEATLSNNEQLLALIEDMEQVVPSDVLVTSITAAESGVSFNMTAESRESVAQLIINMKELSELTDVSVASISSGTDSNNNEIWTFTMSVTYATYDPTVEAEEVEETTEEEE